MIGVSKRMFSHAMRLYEPGSNSSESLKLAAEQGLLNVSDASREVDELKEVQDEAVGLVLNDKFKTVLSAVREVHRGRAQPTVPDTLIPESWHGPRGNVALHNCKIEELQALVPPDSVDAIITGVPDEDGAPPDPQRVGLFRSPRAETRRGDVGVLPVKTVCRMSSGVCSTGPLIFSWSLTIATTCLAESCTASTECSFGACRFWSGVCRSSYSGMAMTSYNCLRLMATPPILALDVGMRLAQN